MMSHHSNFVAGGRDWPGGTKKYCKFALAKSNMDTQVHTSAHIAVQLQSELPHCIPLSVLLCPCLMHQLIHAAGILLNRTYILIYLDNCDLHSSQGMRYADHNSPGLLDCQQSTACRSIHPLLSDAANCECTCLHLLQMSRMSASCSPVLPTNTSMMLPPTADLTRCLNLVTS